MFDVLKVKNIFCIIINMMKIFHFIFKMLKNLFLKVELSRIKKMFLFAQNV
jgi:hypothetical protein